MDVNYELSRENYKEHPAYWFLVQKSHLMITLVSWPLLCGKLPAAYIDVMKILQL
jgi:hypothetical protein